MALEKFTSPRWTNADHNAIDGIATLSNGADVPFTANPNDPHSAPIFERAVAGEFGDIADYVPPSPPASQAPSVPTRVTMRQARRALLGAGLLATVNSALAAMPGAAGDAARIDWEFSSEVHRDWPLIAALKPVLGLSDAQIDDLFIAASKQ